MNVLDLGGLGDPLKRLPLKWVFKNSILKNSKHDFDKIMNL